MNKIAFLEFLGLEYDAGIVLQEPELENSPWTSLDKFDKDLYESICCLLRNEGRTYIPFK